tara:strand:- start:112 stop:279 length:168 start_codon:yes stop_codon:yes gene_type:complete
MKGKQMTESTVEKLKRWIKNVLGGMGGAVVSEKSKSVPPNIGDQPYRDKPKKGVL